MKRAQASLFWLMLQYESLLLQLCTALFSKRAQSKCPTPTACGYVNGSSVSGDEECMNVIFWSEACKCILLGKSVCVCVWGGETGRGLFLGGMWRINKCVRIKKKKWQKKKKQTQKDDMTQPFFCFLRCHLSALLQRWRQLIVCTVSATSQQLQNRENNENVGTSHWNITVKLQDDGMLQQCEHLVWRIWSLRQPYLSISPSRTLSL